MTDELNSQESSPASEINLKAKANIGDIVVLQIVDMTNLGAFLDWGLGKDLYLPTSEQIYDLNIGDDAIVYIYKDKEDRPIATMKIEKHLKKTATEFKENQEVELIIYDETDLGFKAVVNGVYQGMLYKNEVFQELYYGQTLPAHIKKLRPDGKLDLVLLKMGHEGGDQIAIQILEMLKENNGFLDITARTSPEKIYSLFGASKKKYKIALGGLYKRRLIAVQDDGIRLVSATEQHDS